MDITKGTVVRARWFDARVVGLAGVQAKVEGTEHEIVGPVRHVRSDHPTREVNVSIHIEHESGEMCAKCGVKEVAVRHEHVIGVGA